MARRRASVPAPSSSDFRKRKHDWNTAASEAVAATLLRLRTDRLVVALLKTWRDAHPLVTWEDVVGEGTEETALAAWRLRRALAGTAQRPQDLRALWKWCAALACGAGEDVLLAFSDQYAEAQVGVRVTQYGRDLVFRASMLEVRVPATWTTSEIAEAVDDFHARCAEGPELWPEQFPSPRRGGRRRSLPDEVLRAHFREFLETPDEVAAEKSNRAARFRAWLLNEKAEEIGERTIRRAIYPA